jgi:hypothetical protein
MQANNNQSDMGLENGWQKLAFISNFLENRNFRVLNNGQLSSSFCQENGVPQGSVMSVSCFLVAINGLKKKLLDKMNLEFPGMDI